ncbi:glycerol-3-phosphate responsive antiterminator [Cohnella ginsengisoli]|uniref:Glycerol uptake operon antiterminator regulatory protein n=1 Tax=Cohnella ginsengisoli TaxID=425004 RepID=A0A9X4QNP1_9BACL|nr:glycerol-3-phosphate responsive antiterminator [Cohnella ginsengisoli]MDG0792622.1 glycerol-3-phosphate responsive antiterminator [Cohnella ginsengisoli]
MTEQRSSLPIIASITKPEQLETVMKSCVKRVNLMTGDILQLSGIVRDLHQAGKQVYVHIEMVAGIGRDNSAIQYLADAFAVDGIISTRTNTIAAARKAGMRSIQRVFAIDTAAVETAIKMVAQSQPDEIEIMPGLMPRVIREIKQRIQVPLIVGGLIRTEAEIQEMLESGADHISIGDTKFW